MHGEKVSKLKLNDFTGFLMSLLIRSILGSISQESLLSPTVQTENNDFTLHFVVGIGCGF